MNISNQLQENSEAVEKREELKKIRVMLFSAMISYPLWGLLAKWIAPTGYDPLWQRLSMSAFVMVVCSSTYTRKFLQKNLSRYYIVCWLYTFHLLFLYWMNADIVFYLISNLLQFPYMVLTFTSKKLAQTYTYTQMLVAVLFSVFVPFKILNPWLYALGIITLGHFLLTVLVEKFNVLNELKKSKRMFDLTLSNMLEGVMLLDSKGIVIAYNNTADSLLAFNNQSFLGKKYTDISIYKESFVENFIPCSDEEHPIFQAIKKNASVMNKVLGIKKINGEIIWLQINIQPILLNDETRFLVTFSDFSSIKMKQDQKIIEQAHQAMTAKLSSIFTIAGGVAHEINNPLGIIIARLQNLQKKILADDLDKTQGAEIIQKTINTAYRIAKIVTGLKALSSPADDYQMEQVPLEEIIKESLVLFEENFKQLNIKLTVDDIPELKIFCKKIPIQQTISNLLENAKDAVSDVQDKWVHISFQQDAESISIAVYDSGIINSPEIKERMMEPFYTTKDVGKGAGLGLSISKAIIENHEGELFLDPDSLNTGLIIRLKKV